MSLIEIYVVIDGVSMKMYHMHLLAVKYDTN
jgi:hypothetical protein